MSEDLRKLLNKKKPDPPAEKPAGEKTKPKGRYIETADGKIIELDDLRKDEISHNAWHPWILTDEKGRLKGWKKRQLPSKYVAPQYLRDVWATDKPLNEKQRRYRDDVVDAAFLRRRTPKTQKSNNPQRLHRYILWTEIVACKNGFIYYSLPLLVSLIIFIAQLFIKDFWVNALFSTVVLLDFLLIRYAIKEVPEPLTKLLFIALTAGANWAIYTIVNNYPDFLAGLDLFFAVRMLVIIYAVYHFSKFYVYFAMCYDADCKLDFGNVVQIKAGKPRCGKTSSGAHDVFMLAKMKWQELVFDYWDVISREDEILAKGDPNELLYRNEVLLSYEFYTKSPCIPCLWSNIGIFDKKGRAAHKITIEHLKGLSRLPLYSVVLLDEIGAILKADDGLNRKDTEKPLDISDMFRLGGHFLKWCVIGCEQDFNHIYIDCRRVVGFNQVIQGQQWVCKPTLFLGIYNTLKFLISDGLDKNMTKNPKTAKFMKKFKSFVYSIGFRDIRYGFATNTETEAGTVSADADTQLVKLSGVKRRLYPSNLAVDYDDRAYKQKYASYFDKVIRGELHKHLYIEQKDENTAAFVNTTAALLEKREAQKDKIRKVG